MNVDLPLQLLGGLSAQAFMQRHWQKKPLVIRQAIPDFVAPLDRAGLFALASQPDVESRLVVQANGDDSKWRFRQGPFARRSLPPLNQPGWTLLVQGVDLHNERAHRLLQQFRFVPDARLDDLMVSYASDRGGVGPHFDSYDVFLLQAKGQRRWRIGRQKDLSLQPNMPLKILAHFEPEMEVLLNPGDMLYLPPRYAHDGIAVGDCMTYSIGFRSPSRGELAAELLQRLAQDASDQPSQAHYTDPRQPAAVCAGQVPKTMLRFAQDALARALRDPLAVQRALGEYLSEPKASVYFDSDISTSKYGALRLDRCTRMLYDDRHLFVNGESFLATGRDARLMRTLTDERQLSAAEAQSLSAAAQLLVIDWIAAGWLHRQVS